LVVEDGPTLTHGEMAFGAGLMAANAFGAAQIVDPRPFAVNSIKEVFARYPHIGPVLPAMGYSEQQIDALAQTINGADCDAVLFTTPVQLDRIVKLRKPAIRARYNYQDDAHPWLEEIIIERLNLQAISPEGGR
jgi:predicted GTPase